MIPFGEVKTDQGKPITSEREKMLVDKSKPTDKNFADVLIRLTGEGNKFFSDMLVSDNEVCPTITSGGKYYRQTDKSVFTDEDVRRCTTFPSDYNFKKNRVQYVCGMSVPPNMTANIGVEIWKQWLSKK